MHRGRRDRRPTARRRAGWAPGPAPLLAATGQPLGLPPPLVRNTTKTQRTSAGACCTTRSRALGSAGACTALSPALDDSAPVQCPEGNAWRIESSLSLAPTRGSGWQQPLRWSNRAPGCIWAAPIWRGGSPWPRQSTSSRRSRPSRPAASRWILAVEILFFHGATTFSQSCNTAASGPAGRTSLGVVLSIC